MVVVEIMFFLRVIIFKALLTDSWPQCLCHVNVSGGGDDGDGVGVGVGVGGGGDVVEYEVATND